MRGRRLSYSEVEWAWLEANRQMVISDYHRAFCEAFQRADVSAAHLHGLRKRKGWKVGRAPGRTAGRHRRFSSVEIEWLSANRTLEIGPYHQGFVAHFAREDVTAEQLHGLRKRKKWKTGRTGHFAQGQEPPNKGLRCPDGVGGRHPNARKTQFRKGQEPLNTKWLGHERVRTDGYVEISVDETNPYTGYERRYVLKHLREWEAVHGPVPDGHCLKCLDGDKANTSPANWELIPRAIIPRLNGGRTKRTPAYDQAAPEVRPALLNMARLEHRVRQIRRAARQD